MKPKEIALLVITLGFTFLVGPAFAYYSLLQLLILLPIDLESSLTALETVILIPFMVLWYLLWSFIGLFSGMILARPLCGAAAISALGVAGFIQIPLLSSIYHYIVARFYRSGS